MPNLIIDTTTTGYWQYNQAPTSPNQPHMIGLAAILEEDDGTIRDQMSRIVQLPKGFAVSEGAEQFHGIRTIDVKENGEPLKDIMAQYIGLLEQTTQIVAFNSTHQSVVLDKSFVGAGLERPIPLPPELCMMRLTTGVCKIIDRNGSYKWPKLAEAYFYFAKAPLTVDFTSGARDVMSQRVAAVRRIFHGYQAAKRAEAREEKRRADYPEDYVGDSASRR